MAIGRQLLTQSFGGITITIAVGEEAVIPVTANTIEEVLAATINLLRSGCPKVHIILKATENAIGEIKDLRRKFCSGLAELKRQGECFVDDKSDTSPPRLIISLGEPAPPIGKLPTMKPAD